MSAELHLPDLPELTLSVGTEPGQAARPPLALRHRLWQWLGTSLPIVMMALLALGTWYLARLTPAPGAAPGATAARHDADYSLRHFSSQRFDATGRLLVEMEGAQLRHFPDTDNIEIDTIQVRAHDPEGREIRATARQAVFSADGNRVTLRGGAQVHSRAPGVVDAEILGEHLVVWVKEQRVEATKQVIVRQGLNEFKAQGLVFDGRTRLLSLQGPARGEFRPAPPARR